MAQSKAPRRGWGDQTIRFVEKELRHSEAQKHFLFVWCILQKISPSTVQSDAQEPVSKCRCSHRPTDRELASPQRWGSRDRTTPLQSLTVCQGQHRAVSSLLSQQPWGQPCLSSLQDEKRRGRLDKPLQGQEPASVVTVVAAWGPSPGGFIWPLSP